MLTKGKINIGFGVFAVAAIIVLIIIYCQTCGCNCSGVQTVVSPTPLLQNDTLHIPLSLEVQKAIQDSIFQLGDELSALKAYDTDNKAKIKRKFEHSSTDVYQTIDHCSGNAQAKNHTFEEFIDKYIIKPGARIEFSNIVVDNYAVVSKEDNRLKAKANVIQGYYNFEKHYADETEKTILFKFELIEGKVENFTITKITAHSCKPVGKPDTRVHFKPFA